MTGTVSPLVELPAAEPPINVYESGSDLSVALPIPGAHAQHVEIVVSPHRLRVDAACKYPQTRQHYLRRDWQVGRWAIDLPLPRRIDPARTRATLNLGVLVVMAPISDEGDGEHRPEVAGS
ncbi:MAG TPA: Hsp20/alpha crystallin family protein [Candidatus Dormibacteraeota bacterium]